MTYRNGTRYLGTLALGIAISPQSPRARRFGRDLPCAAPAGGGQVFVLVTKMGWGTLVARERHDIRELLRQRAHWVSNDRQPA